ncbi:hypothetical protein [Streptomyces amakusaensis]|uniref:Uncharacterized protein n=1 Tax=Streptomyces amakusaensis TaxID=67271 RepID=A0ABW0ACR8_9ACTN
MSDDSVYTGNIAELTAEHEVWSTAAVVVTSDPEDLAMFCGDRVRIIKV